MTRVVGNHTIRFGGTWNRYQKTENAATGNQGTFAFSPASVPSSTSTFLQSFANFLTGNVATFTQSSEDVTPDVRAVQWEVYGLDDWRVRPNLTLNIGIRYSMFRQPYDQKGELTNFDPAVYSASAAPPMTSAGLLTSSAQNYLNGIIINGQNSPFGRKVSSQDSKDFAPRFGFAWDPYRDGKTAVRGGYGMFYDATLFGTFEQNIFANPPYVNAVTLSNAVTLDNPTGGTGAVSVTPKILRGTPTEFKTPYSQQWSLELQREVLPKTIVTASYVGTKGTHLLGIIDINEVAPNLAYTSGFAPLTTNYTSTAAEVPLNLIRPYKGYSSINVVEPWFNSNYHSLQVFAQRRFKGENQVSIAYTWARNMTDNGSDRSNAPQNSYNFKADYARATFDRRQVANINFIYMLPFFTAQKGIIGKAAGGWQLSGIGSLYTGLPYTVTTSSSDPAALGLLPGAASARPDLLCDPYAGVSSTRLAWFNTACFKNPAAGDHHIGNAGRSVLLGPGYVGFSLSFSKNVVFGPENRFRFQLRAEASNALNHTNPSTFGSTNNTSSLFGTITGYRDPRTVQLGAKLYF